LDGFQGLASGSVGGSATDGAVGIGIRKTVVLFLGRRDMNWLVLCNGLSQRDKATTNGRVSFRRTRRDDRLRNREADRGLLFIKRGHIPSWSKFKLGEI
jgi:hypothetical protein